MTVINVTDAVLKGSVKGPTFTGDVDGATFTGAVTYTDTTTPPVDPPPTSTAGLITNFSAASGSRFQIDGVNVQPQNANKSWSIKKLDDYTLQFEVHSGDHWSSGSYNDAPNERSEIEFSTRYASGKQTTMESVITVAPGPVTTAGHLDLAQFHVVSGEPPCPVTLQLEKGTDKLQLILQTPGWTRPYLAPRAVVRGQPMNIKIEAKMGSSGYVGFWLDGTKVVNYNGSVGGNNQQHYWKTGIYRGAATETTTATVRNIHIIG